MNLRDVKKLKVDDKFRRPSRNGWRVYRVVNVEGEQIDCCDQHGYYIRLRPAIWGSSFGNKEFMRTAELIDANTK